MKSLNHASIPQIYDLEEDEKYLYMVEQYIEGEPLSLRVKRESIPYDLLFLWADELCNVIEYLHTRIPPVYHLDLKPDNIIVAEEHLWLIDFGSAVTADQQPKVIFGTPKYAPPEQKKGGKLDERCDIYGVGMLLYYMAARQKQIQQGLKKSVRSNLVLNSERQLNRIIWRCRNPVPALRYRNIRQLTAALEACKTSEHLKKGKKPIRIAVTGAMERAGATHISLLLCSFLAGYSRHVMYLEKNNSGSLKELADRKGWKQWKEKKLSLCYREKGFFLAKQSPEVSFGNLSDTALEPFDWLIEDYGKFETADREQICSADLCLVILSGREWELESAENSIRTFTDSGLNQGAIGFLFNLTEPSQFRCLIKNMGHFACQCFSYEPDPFDCGKEARAVFQTCTSMLMRQSKKGGRKKS